MEEITGNHVESSAAKFRLSSGRPCSVSQWENAVKNFMQLYCADLAKIEGLYIGHIKAILVFPSGYIKASCVDAALGVYIEGEISAEAAEEATLTVNSVVFGINSSANISLLGNTLNIALSETGICAEEIEIPPACHHHHHHHHHHH